MSENGTEGPRVPPAASANAGNAEDNPEPNTARADTAGAPNRWVNSAAASQDVIVGIFFRTVIHLGVPASLVVRDVVHD